MKYLVGYHMPPVFRWFRKRKRIIKTLVNDSFSNTSIEVYVKCLGLRQTCVSTLCVEGDNKVLTALVPGSITGTFSFLLLPICISHAFYNA